MTTQIGSGGPEASRRPKSRSGGQEGLLRLQGLIAPDGLGGDVADWGMNHWLAHAAAQVPLWIDRSCSHLVAA